MKIECIGEKTRFISFVGIVVKRQNISGMTKLRLTL
jgi:hypothetical protein